MGASESNAGDDFHFWWAAGRALALIRPGTATCLLTVEGLAHLDDPDDMYEIADVVEYLDGSTFDDANEVLISQLKYSTRHPTRSWTAARLASKRARRRADGHSEQARSVIADLAITYRQLVDQYGRDGVLGKARIRLVSNQPLDSLLDEAVGVAAGWIRAANRPVRRRELAGVLTPEGSEIIQTLVSAVGTRLSSTQFCDFLTVLDLSVLGTSGRAELAREVRAAVVKMSPGRGSDPAWRLFNLVREQALPESRRTGVSANNVLAALDIGERADLYPARPRFADLADPLPSPSASALARTVIAHLGRVVVAGGAAGVGKTTVLRQIREHLPVGSSVVLYDCYGAGEYLNAGEERHTPQRFVMQVINELAQSCGTSLLLQSPVLQEDLWRHFTNTVRAAAANLTPGAVLVLAVDGADNAAVAAQHRGEGSFLDGLLAVRLPPTVCVIVSARSHRVSMIGAAGKPRVDIAPFDLDASAGHLRRYRTDITATDAATFHERTAGNPRVQFYVLEQAQRAGWDMVHLLDACSRTPEGLFSEIVDSALAGTSALSSGHRWLAALLALSRPISMRVLAQALQVDESEVSAFAEGMTPGVEIMGDRIQFRDEDFETYVRDRVDPAAVTEAHAQLAQLLYTLRTEDADAAAHVADHQFAAGHHDALLDMVLAEDAPLGIIDGFRRQQVQGRRLDLAALAVAAKDDGAIAVRVAARACDTASRLSTLSELVRTDLDLVARYTDIDLLRTHALRHDPGDWLGPAHMRLAAALARDPERHVSAREALRDASAWVDRWMAHRDGEVSHWQLTSEDLAAAAEAVYRLDGVAAADTWLRRWRPASAVRDAASGLAARIAGSLGPDAMLQALREVAAPGAVQAPFLAHATSPNAPPDAGWLTAIVGELTRAELPMHHEPDEPWRSRFLDTVLRHGTPADAEALAQQWAAALPTERWAFQNLRSQALHRLRCHAALAALRDEPIDVATLVPPTLRADPDRDNRPDERRERDRIAWIDSVRPLCAMAVLAARAILGQPVAAAVSQELTARLDGLLAAASHRWFRGDDSFLVWGALAAEAVADAGVDATHLDRLADAAPALLRADAPHLWLDIVELLIHRGLHVDRAADLCVRATTAARTDTRPATDRVELLARAADLASRVSPELGAALFSDTVHVATGINDDAARMLVVHADLAHRASIAEKFREGVAESLICAVENVASHVTDSRLVPYAEVAAAAASLDIGVGLAAVSRWDDEDRISWSSTMSAALIGAVDADGLEPGEALLLDHLLDHDHNRLRFQMSMAERLLARPGGVPAARLAVKRASAWLRLQVPALSQPRFANMLLTWATAHQLDGAVSVELAAVAALAPADERPDLPIRTSGKAPAGPDDGVQSMLESPQTRLWVDLAQDVEQLAEAHMHGEPLRHFVREVVAAAAPAERVAALAALAALPRRHGAATALPVLVELVERWRGWPGVTDRIVALFPELVARWLPDLAWRDDTDVLLTQLRTLADDATIRRTVLQALPSARTSLTTYGWRNVTTLLGRLCPPADAAAALVGLLDDRITDDVRTDPTEVVRAVGRPPTEPLVMMLWSAFAHPHRAMRWRACHAVHELCRLSGPPRAAQIVTALVGLVGRDGPGRYRDPALYFYRLSADAAVLTALARVAADRPGLLAEHSAALVRIATDREQPHVQIRGLARDVALAAMRAGIAGPVAASEQLAWVNLPTACHVDRDRDHWPDRQVSDDRRYRFDQMDTIPYWYAPLARLFGVPVDAVAERAERWILDRWGGARTTGCETPVSCAMSDPGTAPTTDTAPSHPTRTSASTSNTTPCSWPPGNSWTTVTRCTWRVGTTDRRTAGSPGCASTCRRARNDG